ncbi:MAG: hypothetical protein RJA52_1147, partial [Bacteroidota bacterium]
KAGTTWLSHQLRKSDKVWMPRQKELHYFDRSLKYPSPSHLHEGKLYRRLLNPVSRKQFFLSSKTCIKALLRGDYEKARWIYKWFLSNYNNRWYRSLFRYKKGVTAYGEITPSYSILDKDDIEQMYKVNPNLRLVLILRNPIDRDWSSLKFSITRKFTDYDLHNDDQLIELLESPYFIKRSDYLSTIKNYSEIFPKEQLLICFYDAIVEDAYNLLKDIYEHIGLSESLIDSKGLTDVHNASLKMEIPEKIYKFLKIRHERQIIELGDILGSYAKLWAGKLVSPHELHPTTKL